MIKAVFQVNAGFTKGKIWYSIYRINNYGNLIPVKVAQATIKKLLNKK